MSDIITFLLALQMLTYTTQKCVVHLANSESSECGHKLKIVGLLLSSEVEPPGMMSPGLRPDAMSFASEERS